MMALPTGTVVETGMGWGLGATRVSGGVARGLQRRVSLVYPATVSRSCAQTLRAHPLLKENPVSLCRPAADGAGHTSQHNSKTPRVLHSHWQETGGRIFRGCPPLT